MSTPMGEMTISIGRGADAPSVTVPLAQPETFDDPQWAAWNCDEADICALAVRQIRVDIANGGARDALRDVVKAHPKSSDKWLAPVLAKVRGWKRGAQRTSRKVMDARGMNLTEAQVAHFEGQGFTVLTD